VESERGGILVFVIIAVAILGVVGVSFMHLVMAENNSVVHHARNVRAFYTAESGLNWARDGLLRGSIVLPNIVVGGQHILYRSAPFGSVVGAQVLGDVGALEIIVRRLSPTQLELTSRGGYNISRSTVAIRLDEVLSLGGVENLSRHQVVGMADLGRDTTVTGNISGASFRLAVGASITGLRIVGSPLTVFGVPLLTNPIGLTPRGSVTVATGSATSLISGSSYTNVTVNGTGVLIMNVPDHNDVTISINNLTVNAGSRVNRSGGGTGRLLLHIGNTLLLRDDSTFNASGSAERTIIHYHGATRLIIGRRASVTGAIVTNSGVDLGRDVIINGYIITGSTLNTNIDRYSVITGVVYAPRSSVHIARDVRINGTVVVGALTTMGRVRLTYATGLLDGFVGVAGLYALWGNNLVYSFHTWDSR